ncbi:LptA/OstA family protein [Pseudooctadecabacter jejudonensis]|uniref:LPS assembly outer membrane complex protein LptD n=1 Tax=Pseudooctadecabacter jejudonensis TaxID=1391910 RepID=A0A1Y5S8M2_9RHOB|nr:LptA/OstA family protein [Pseudooctadecabacter jejudonensis]SLN34269.1 LPS assembly outer membrane complex protein LptD [Pseudooctadecabacter jejudonensis]
MTFLKSLLVTVSMLIASGVSAQTNVNLGGLSADPTAPVEITADNLSVDQDSGTAVFEGNVVLGQGQLRLSAARVQVVYDGAAGNISRLSASGGVTFVTDTEAAEAASADYNLDAGTLVMRGDVLLTQGPSAISADTMRINLTTGSAQMEGRVRTILNQGGN